MAKKRSHLRQNRVHLVPAQRATFKCISHGRPKDLNRDGSPHFSALWDKNGWNRAKTAGNLNLGVS